MDYVYVALLVFLLLAIFVPLSMVITSIMLGSKRKTNSTKRLNYESAESPMGGRRDITNDYLAYFPLFLAFEVTGVVIIIWTFVYANLQQSTNFYVLLLLIGATVLSVLTASIVKKRDA